MPATASPMRSTPRRIYIETDNVASRGVARRCGFVEEGVLRGRIRIGDARRDALLYARLAADRSDE